jgi:hypothetical protein
MAPLALLFKADRRLSTKTFQRFQFFDVRQVFAGRGRLMAATMGSPSLADHDESNFGRNWSLALARRSALSSCFLAVNLLLPQFVSAPRPFAPLRASQICSRPSRAYQLFPAVARKVLECRRLSGWCAAAGRTCIAGSCCASEASPRDPDGLRAPVAPARLPACFWIRSPASPAAWQSWFLMSRSDRPLLLIASLVGTAQSRHDWSAAAHPRRTKRCCPSFANRPEWAGRKAGPIEKLPLCVTILTGSESPKLKRRKWMSSGRVAGYAVMASFGASTATSEDAVSRCDRSTAPTLAFKV